MRRDILLLGMILTIFFIVYDVSAHVPTAPESGETLETAVEIEDPTKSWVIYGHLHEGAEPQYYSFEMESGQRIRLTLMIPINHEPLGFRPSMVLMGPGLTNQGSLPEFVEIPESGGIRLYEPETPRAEYEGFTPTSFYLLIDVDINAPAIGKYYLAVYDPSMEGNYAITLGYREEYNLIEWVAVPFSVLLIHQWTGQSFVMIILPIVVTLVIGLMYLVQKRKDFLHKKQLLTLIGILGGLLFISSGVVIFYEMVNALLQVPANFQVIITFIFGLIPILLGFATIRIFLSEDWAENKSKLSKLVLLAIVAPFAWAGYIIGPILVAIISSVLLFRNKVPNISSPLPAS